MKLCVAGPQPGPSAGTSHSPQLCPGNARGHLTSVTQPAAKSNIGTGRWSHPCAAHKVCDTGD